MQTYISEHLPNADVLAYHEHAMHPEIARRFGALVEIEIEHEETETKACAFESAIESALDMVSDLEALADTVTDAIDYSTKAEREKQLAEWQTEFRESLEKVRHELATAGK